MAELRPTEILLSAEQIQKRVAELAAEIRRDFPGRPAPRRGAEGRVHLPVRSRRGTWPATSRSTSWRVSSYAKGTTSSGEVRLLKDLDTALDGRNVIIVEDIVDTGLTLTYLQDILRARNPKSLRTACLLSKPSRRKVDVKVEYIGFTIEDRFVVGYGLDYAEQYRNLPHIAVDRDLTADRDRQRLTCTASRTFCRPSRLRVARSPPRGRASQPAGPASAPCRSRSSFCTSSPRVT